MRPIILLLLLLLCLDTTAQDKPLSAEDRAILDSLLKHDDFLLLLQDMKRSKSHLMITAGLGNSHFSTRNNRINAIQQDHKFVFTPSLSYLHKSGLGIMAAAFLIDHKGRTDFYQYSLSPSYTFTGSKQVEATVSYTRFFRKSGYENVASPLEYEFFGKLQLVKPWVQPGISLGYAAGDYTTYKRIDTVLFGVRRVFMDTMVSSFSDFSTSAYIQHSFEFYNVLGKKDGLGIIPRLLLNAGTSRYSISHQNPFLSRLITRDEERFRNAGKLDEKQSFAIRSASIDLNAQYIIGKLGIAPGFFLDYYIPETTEKRFSFIYSIDISLIF